MYSDIIGSIEVMASEILALEKGVALNGRKGLIGNKALQGDNVIKLRQFWLPELMFKSI